MAVTGIILWAVFHYNDTWQLIINTSMTIITFLMVFLIQNTQNHDNVALHIKLDEFLRVTQGAQDRLLHLENLDVNERKALHKKYKGIGKRPVRSSVGTWRPKKRLSTPKKSETNHS
nr:MULTISPECIES: low affinity iron permease family protein [Pseudomonas]